MEVVPRELRSRTIGHIFHADGHKLMWSMGNGLVMEYIFAKTFERLDFCLIPHAKEGKPDELKLVLFNESIRHELVHDGKTWDDFDGAFLEFGVDCDSRPERRFLFFHYFVCLLKSQRHFISGWENIKEKAKNGSLWLTPGTCLSSKSTGSPRIQKETY